MKTKKPSIVDIVDEVVAEYRRAVEKFPPYHSDREGFDILDEEVQELKQAIRHETPQQARAEAIQVAAVAIRLVMDCYRKIESEGNDE